LKGKKQLNLGTDFCEDEIAEMGKYMPVSAYGMGDWLSLN
jgi:hypothetical protein